jgi:hypothetical protein
LPELSSIKEIVMTDLYEERASLNMKNTINKAQELAHIQSFDAVAPLVHASLYTTSLFGISDQKQINDLERMGLPVRSMMMLEKIGSLMIHNGEKDSFLIKLDGIQPFNEESYNAAQPEVKKSIVPLQTKLFLDGIVASLHRNATIETNEILLTTIQ